MKAPVCDFAGERFPVVRPAGRRCNKWGAVWKSGRRNAHDLLSRLQRRDSCGGFQRLYRRRVLPQVREESPLQRARRFRSPGRIPPGPAAAWHAGLAGRRNRGRDRFPLLQSCGLDSLLLCRVLVRRHRHLDCSGVVCRKFPVVCEAVHDSVSTGRNRVPVRYRNDAFRPERAPVPGMGRWRCSSGIGRVGRRRALGIGRHPEGRGGADPVCSRTVVRSKASPS